LLTLTGLTTMIVVVDNMEAAAITPMEITTGDMEVAVGAAMEAAMEVATEAVMAAMEVAMEMALEVATEDKDSALVAMVVADSAAAMDSEVDVDTLVLEEDSVATELEDMAVMVLVDMEDTTGAVEINFVNWIYSLVDSFNE
jgi:hypothetical protein